MQAGTSADIKRQGVLGWEGQAVVVRGFWGHRHRVPLVSAGASPSECHSLPQGAKTTNSATLSLCSGETVSQSVGGWGKTKRPV